MAEIRAVDRCDRCGAGAKVLLECGLLFCGHHYRQHEPAIIAKGLTVLIDQREEMAATHMPMVQLSPEDILGPYPVEGLNG